MEDLLRAKIEFGKIVFSEFIKLSEEESNIVVDKMHELEKALYKGSLGKGNSDHHENLRKKLWPSILKGDFDVDITPSGKILVSNEELCIGILPAEHPNANGLFKKIKAKVKDNLFAQKIAPKLFSN